MSDPSPSVFQCERCGLPASIGPGFAAPILAVHLLDAAECRQAGGPFSGGLNAAALEARWREVLGLDS